MQFNDINIGFLISKHVEEKKISMERIQKFLDCDENTILKMYHSKNLDTEILLRWCKLLEYDFFRIYSHHLILYSPPVNTSRLKKIESTSILPTFRKNIYTKELIDFILEEINTGEKTKQRVIDEYGIPKTTLYKWITKYNEKR